MKNPITRRMILLIAAVLALIAAGCSDDQRANKFAVVRHKTTEETKKVFLPGEAFELDNVSGKDLEVVYVFGGPRNFEVSKTPGADSDELADGLTKDDTRIKVSYNAKWTVTRDKEIFKTSFMDLCNKLSCYITDDPELDDKGSTPGWDRLLRENIQVPMTKAIQATSQEFNDEIWRKDTKWTEFGAAVSERFAIEFRQATGLANSDVFCGTGDLSYFKNEKDLTGFVCGPITVTIYDIEPADKNLRKMEDNRAAAKASKEANAQILDAATVLYGDRATAAAAIATQKAIEACNDTTNCTIILDPDGSTRVAGG
jgi:hypothetical protein